MNPIEPIRPAWEPRIEPPARPSRIDRRHRDEQRSDEEPREDEEGGQEEPEDEDDGPRLDIRV